MESRNDKTTIAAHLPGWVISSRINTIYQTLMNRFMKKIYVIITALLMLLSYSVKLNAQTGCSNPGCTSTALNVSTGYDFGTSTYKTPLALESNWQMYAVPSNATNLSPTGPVWVISPNSAWGNFPNAKWLSPFQNNAYSINNPPLPASPFYGAFKFKNCFCLCQGDSIHLDFDMMADDEAEIYLDGTTLLASGIQPNSGHFTLASKLVVDTTIYLGAGNHCISVELYNVGGGAMGFSIEGTVTGAHMLSSVCCNPTGSICGTKYKDVNCDGSVNTSDPAVLGWKIYLKNNLGVIIDSAVTDTQGNYCFHNLPAGYYGVMEGTKPSWTQSYPGGSGQYTNINVTPSSATLASFGNCDHTASICGTKYRDVNCDGVIDPRTDYGIYNWMITLLDGGGNPIATAYTDYSGHYCFNQLPVGTYTVMEQGKIGWTQTYPASPGTYTTTLSPGQQFTANFANCPPPNLCDSLPRFHYDIRRCGVYFTADLSVFTATPPYQVMTTAWNFGDGHTSNDLNPVHYYSNPGVYHVCLTVTLFDGERCCKVVYCEDIPVNEPCEGGCNIDANIEPTWDDQTCIFTFTANIFNTNTPIHTWYWEFGDGNTGYGPVVTHKYLAPGPYQVCLYLFGRGPGGECCFQKICMDIFVNCSPCDPPIGPGGGNNDPGMRAPEEQKQTNPSGIDKPVNMLPSKPDNVQSAIILSDKNMIVLNQNVPNPFAESTVIAYNIPSNFIKAQIVFTNMNGKTVRTFDIKTKGEGRLTVFGDDLSTGVYTYTLIIDNKVIESKSMIKR